MVIVLFFDVVGIYFDFVQGLVCQFYVVLCEWIFDGCFGSCMWMFVSCELVQVLKVLCNIVVWVYEQLYVEGYIDGCIGDGIYVVELQEILGRVFVVVLSVFVLCGLVVLVLLLEGVL